MHAIVYVPWIIMNKAERLCWGKIERIKNDTKNRFENCIRGRKRERVYRFRRFELGFYIFFFHSCILLITDSNLYGLIKQSLLFVMLMWLLLLPSPYNITPIRKWKELALQNINKRDITDVHATSTTACSMYSIRM